MACFDIVVVVVVVGAVVLFAEICAVAATAGDGDGTHAQSRPRCRFARTATDAPATVPASADACVLRADCVARRNEA